MIPQQAIAIIKEFEGLELKAYRCPAGVWTIGYGCTRINGRPVKERDVLASEQHASTLLMLQLNAEYLPKLELIPGWDEMSEGQQSALISFAWNLGASFYGANGFATITKYLKAKEWHQVPDALQLYVKAGGKTLPGLVRRRKAEADLWIKGFNLEEKTMLITAATEIQDLDKTAIAELQGYLQKLDYYGGAIDGIAGKNTNYAWATWKSDHWLDNPTRIGPGSYAQIKAEADAIKTINWKDFNSKISKYFSVGEVANQQSARLPTSVTIQQNAIRLATELDKVREWWGSGIGVTSWYRPPHVEVAVGGSGANHPFGYAADIYPIKGSIRDFQQRFKKEWYDTGKWQGGFGLGAKKGFIHLDLRSRREWNY